MKRALILACGNSQRGDDGVGPCVAEELRQHLGDPRVDISCTHQWTPELAEKISKVDAAIFVDASASLLPGEIHVRAVMAGPEKLGSMTHSLSPENLLGLAESLYRRVPEKAFLLTIGGRSFEPGGELSPIVQQAIPGAIAQIEGLLESLAFA